MQLAWCLSQQGLFGSERMLELRLPDGSSGGEPRRDRLRDLAIRMSASPAASKSVFKFDRGFWTLTLMLVSASPQLLFRSSVKVRLIPSSISISCSSMRKKSPTSSLTVSSTSLSSYIWETLLSAMMRLIADMCLFCIFIYDFSSSK